MPESTGNTRPFRYEWDGTLRRLALPPLVKLVASYMSQYGDNDGRHVRPGVERLVAETGLSDKTVRRAQGRLRTLGLIVLVRSGSAQGRRGQANEYKLAIPDDILEHVDLVPLETKPRPEQAGKPRKPRATPVDNSTDGPVDNPDHRSQETGDTAVGEPSPDPEHRSPEDRCSDGSPVTGDPNTGHSCDLPPTKTTPAVTPPRQHSGFGRTTTHATRDQASVDNPIDLSSRFCPHGNSPRRRRDGLPRCDVCRKEAA